MHQIQIITLLLHKVTVPLMFETIPITELTFGAKHLELAKQTLKLVLDSLWDITRLALT